MTTKPIRVAIVDDNDMLRYGMSVVLSSLDGFEYVGEARSGYEAVELCRRSEPDVLLVDLIMPEMDGIATIRQVLKEMPTIRCVALTSFDEAHLVRDALKAGAISYLIKNLSLDELAQSIREAYTSKAVEVLRDPDEAKAVPSLTPAEADILQAMCRGHSDVEMLVNFSLDVAVLEAHVASILSKLGAANRADAIIIAVRDGLVRAD